MFFRHAKDKWRKEGGANEDNPLTPIPARQKPALTAPRSCCFRCRDRSTSKTSLKQVIFGISLLLNCLVVAPLLLLTPKIFLTPDGVAVQVSHKHAEHVLHKFVIQSPNSNRGKDDLNRYGKSCVFVQQAWKCQECGLPNNNNNNSTAANAVAATPVCQPLQRVRTNCDKSMVIRQPWDDPPRVSSSFDPTQADDEVEMRTLRELGAVSLYLKQPLCTLGKCFDLSKCDPQVLTIYANKTESSSSSGSDLIDYAVNHSSVNLTRVSHPDQACLSVTFPDTYATAEELYSADHWSSSNRQGRNNLLWDMGNFRLSPWTGDHAFQQFHCEYAAVASQSLTGPIARVGYDQVLPLVRKWGRRTAPSQVKIHRPRRWLVSFRGDIQHKGIPYYHHRWLASEYWESSDDVFVDVQCRKHHEIYKEYEHPSTIYEEIMWNSTFGFCPGGAGVSSYRLGEYLSTGTIPVVVGDIVAPFAPEIDWSGCWIKVPEARVVDVPRILGEISSQEIRRRQKRCWHLHEMIWGERQLLDNKRWVDEPGVTFTRGMEIWGIRIAQAMEGQARFHQLDNAHKN